MEKKVKLEDVLRKLESLSDSKNTEGMKRFGITGNKVYGVSIPDLRRIAKEIGKNHELALRLWEEDSRETRILASMIDEVDRVDEEQMERWVRGFDSWEVCDQVCMNLFWMHNLAYRKAKEWACREEEFVKRAGFALMAVLAWKDKQTGNERFEEFLGIIKENSEDERNFVKKAVNWALRQIGKRNSYLNRKAIETAEEILKKDSKVSKWIATDALRELKSESVRKRLEV